MSAEPVKYFTQSWRMLNKGDKKWVGHLIILVLLQAIPLIGSIALLGYCYIWSNRTAWGMDTSPTDRTIDVGKLMMTGLITGAVVLVWSIVLGFVYMILTMFFSWIPFLGGVIIFVLTLPFTFLTVLSFVAAQRAAIYNHVWPGLQIDKVWDMFSRDWGGLFKIFLIYLALSILLIIVGLILIVPVVFLAIGPSALGIAAADEESGLAALIIAMVSIGPAALFCLAAVLFLQFAANLLNLLGINAIGLWMRQLKPETWGSYNDAIPQQNQATQVSYVYAPVRAQQNQNTYEQTPSTQPVKPDDTQVSQETSSSYPKAPEQVDDSLVGPPHEANTKDQEELAKQDDLSIVESQKQATEVDNDKNNLEEDSK